MPTKACHQHTTVKYKCLYDASAVAKTTTTRNIVVIALRIYMRPSRMHGDAGHAAVPSVRGQEAHKQRRRCTPSPCSYSYATKTIYSKKYRSKTTMNIVRRRTVQNFEELLFQLISNLFGSINLCRHFFFFFLQSICF